MKSIMEEASSVIKAIEKGWIQAGKPQEFSVKVFEEATKNFLGMTTKPAKIAIFFTEKLVSTPSKQLSKQRPPKPESHYQKTQSQQPRRVEFQKPQEKVKAPSEKQEFSKDCWSEEMIQAAQRWLDHVLSDMQQSGITFTHDVKKYHLKFNFSKPVLDDREKEKLLYRSLAYLMMQSLRNTFKKSFRGCKIIFASPNT